MSEFVAGLIVGILVTAALLTFLASALVLRRVEAVLRRLRRPAGAPADPPPDPARRRSLDALFQPPKPAPFTASPPRLDTEKGSGRHASGAPSAPREQAGPEREVERTHLMRAVQAAGPIRVNPTGPDAAEIVAAVDRRTARYR